MKVTTKKATMTNKERVEAVLRREEPDRVPNWPFIIRNFAMVYSGGSVADAYIVEGKVAYEAEKKACQDFDWVFAPALTAWRGSGSRILVPPSQNPKPAFEKVPTKTADEVLALPAIDAKRHITPELIDFARRVYQDNDDNKPLVTIGGLGVVNTAGGITGYTNLCKWMLQRPEVAHHALRLAADYQIEAAQYCKDLFGVDGVMPAGANGAASVISPKHFEQFCLPYLKETHQEIMAMGFKHLRQHPCGDQNRYLPYWQQIPLGDPGIVWVGNEMDLTKAAQYFPNDIIAGNLNSVLIQTGSPDEVYQAARKVIEQGKSLATGFIFAPACELPPLAPVENLMAITRAINDFGWY
ncbi:MAG: hypothetical protein HY528_04510 [Chloroflexi bacterium]|nr:hypothetical protein [Chloroflexota bacterium]